MDLPDDSEFKRDEYFCEMGLGIAEVRLMYQVMSRFLEMWPGGDPDEQIFADFIKQRMFAMKMEHQLMSQD